MKFFLNTVKLPFNKIFFAYQILLLFHLTNRSNIQKKLMLNIRLHNMEVTVYSIIIKTLEA